MVSSKLLILAYYTKNYFNQFKESESVKLPVKWMALESLHYGIFSEKSDVVSFK